MMIRIALFLPVFVLGVASGAGAARAESAPAKVADVTFPDDGRVDFVRHVQPILRTSCAECHSAENKKGRLRLDAKQFAMAGGQSGVVIPSGKPMESILLRRVRGEGGEKQMPFKRPPLPAE